jgi:hypothetical protein
MHVKQDLNLKVASLNAPFPFVFWISWNDRAPEVDNVCCCQAVQGLVHVYNYVF